MLKELARSYLTITRDLTRVMNRLKAIYRGWGIACAGKQVYAPRYRAEWLAKITEPGVRRRAELYYQQFDALAALRQEVRRELLAESRKHPRHEIAAADSLDWPDPRRFVDRSDADTPSLPYQAPTVGLLRTCTENLRQRAISLCWRSAETFQESCDHSRAEYEP